jgi:hypothetical protein
MYFSNTFILSFATTNFFSNESIVTNNSATVSSLFILGLFFIFLALFPNLKVDKVSASL